MLVSNPSMVDYTNSRSQVLAVLQFRGKCFHLPDKDYRREANNFGIAVDRHRINMYYQGSGYLAKPRSSFPSPVNINLHQKDPGLISKGVSFLKYGSEGWENCQMS